MTIFSVSKNIVIGGIIVLTTGCGFARNFATAYNKQVAIMEGKTISSTPTKAVVNTSQDITEQKSDSHQSNRSIIIDNEFSKKNEYYSNKSNTSNDKQNLTPTVAIDDIISVINECDKATRPIFCSTAMSKNSYNNQYDALAASHYYAIKIINTSLNIYSKSNINFQIAVSINPINGGSISTSKYKLAEGPTLIEMVSKHEKSFGEAKITNATVIEKYGLSGSDANGLINWSADIYWRSMSQKAKSEFSYHTIVENVALSLAALSLNNNDGYIKDLILVYKQEIANRVSIGFIYDNERHISGVETTNIENKF